MLDHWYMFKEAEGLLKSFPYHSLNCPFVSARYVCLICGLSIAGLGMYQDKVNKFLLLLDASRALPLLAVGQTPHEWNWCLGLAKGVDSSAARR